MIITVDNINECDIQSVKDNKELLIALLSDLKEINNKTKNTYCIDVQEWHNEYSPERVDPCPDNYGYFSIIYNDEQLGDCMDINVLDNILFILYEFVIETGEF